MKIELRGVTKTYGKTRALDGVSLSIPPGQIVAVLGSNGSGKTTLLRCLAGLATPRRGSILFDDSEFSRDDLSVRQQIMFMADFPFAFWEMSPLQHVGMCLKVYGAHREDAIKQTAVLFRELSLTALADSPLASLSRGQAYKAALCGLLVTDPEVWLLDEPFASGMDPQGIAVFKQRAREAAARGRTIIYTTQIIDVVERFSDRICVLEEGEVRGFGTFEELRLRADSEPALKGIFDALKEA
jgi:ABC-type multidrug transport system ATPase subunit